MMLYPGDPGFVYIDEAEREEIEEIEAHADTLHPLPEPDRLAAIEVFRQAARGGVSKVISLRIDSHMLDGLKAQAATEGLPYQTMIQSILFRYLNGTLVDVKAVKEVVRALQVS